MIATLTAVGIGLGVISLMIPDSNKNEIKTHTELNSLKGNGLRISKNVQLSSKMSKEHTLKVAPSGGYKSRGFIMPNVKSLKNCSIVVTDPSSEIKRECKRDDMIEFVFNPFDIKNSIGFDILANCSNSFEVKQSIELLMINSSLAINKTGKSDKADWIQMSLPLLKSYAIYNFYEKKYTFDTMISNLLTKPLLPQKDKKGISIMEEIMESDISEAKTEFASFIQIASAPQTLACIRNTLTSCLQLFNELNVKKLCRKPTIDFKKFRGKETILYIQIPERYSRHYSPITSVLVQQLMNKLLDHKKGLDVYFLFDEFCNVGKISDINLYLSTCRKHNITIAACIQNLTQLKRLYGELEGKELQELFKTLIVSGGLKDSTEYFSNLIGDKEVKEKNMTKTKPLMSTAELRMLKDNEVIILCNNKRPVRDKIVPF